METESVDSLKASIESLAEDAEKNTDELLTMLSHPAAKVREAVVWALWEGAMLRIKGPLLKLVQEDVDPAVRSAAASVLGRFVYEGLMSHKDKAVLAAIAEVKAYLCGLLYNEGSPEGLRRRALEALSFDTDTRLEELMEAWISSPDEYFRKSAAFGMGRADVPRFSRLLVAALEDPHPLVKTEAMRSVGELGVKKAVPMLESIACGDDEDLAVEAVDALGQISGPRAVKALKKLQWGASPRLQAAIEAALEDTGGEEE